MLRVRTGPECPEGNLSALTRDSNCGIARDREKINLGKALMALLAICRTKEGLRNSREELASCGLAHPPLEAGGRGEGKGANSVPETVPPTKLQTGLQFLTKDFLTFWMVNIHWEGRG